MKKTKIFVYPIGNPNLTISRNPYIFDLIKSLGEKYTVVNKGKISSLGILEGYKYFFNCEYFIFNWTENIPSRKYGLFQTIIFFNFCLLIFLSQKKMIWILHNKEPHSGSTILSQICMWISAHFSKRIITHSTEGLNYLKRKYGNKIYLKSNYLPHPTKLGNIQNLPEAEIQYDYIIWGAIKKYKGIIEFLKFINASEGWKNKKVLICGKCENKRLFLDIKENLTNNIKLIEGYIENEELKRLIAQSKNILFIYHSNSILSSGALIESLYYGKNILGPDAGAFKDLQELNLIQTFQSFEEILRIECLKINQKERFNFISTHDWEHFAKNLLS